MIIIYILLGIVVFPIIILLVDELWRWADPAQHASIIRRILTNTKRPPETTMIGRTGTTATPLKPSGYVLVNGEKYPARSEGCFLDQGRSVHVVTVEGSNIIVKESEQFSQQGHGA